MRKFDVVRSDGTLVLGIIDDSKGGDGQRVELARVNLGGSTIELPPALSLGTSLSQDVSTLTYAADVELDLLGAPLQSLTLNGDVEFTLTNQAAGRGVSVRVVADEAERVLTFPAGWVFLGDRPTSLLATKTGILSLLCWGPADADVVAAFSAEA